MHAVILEFVRADDAADPHAFARGTQHYLVRKADGTYAEARLRWDDALLADLSAADTDAEAAQRLGARLAGMLDGADWAHHAGDIETASAAGERVDVTIRAAAAELFALPWHLLTLPGSGRRVGELPHVLIRHAWPGSADAPRAPSATPHQVRFAWSAAGGAVPASAMLDTLGALSDFDAARDVVPHVTLAALDAALDAEVAVLHLLAHGGATDRGFGAVLDDGLIDAAALRAVLAPYAATLHLVVLTICDSARSAEIAAHLGGLARALHQVGIEAVIGARTPLAVDAALAFTRALYPALFEAGVALEDAVLRALAEAGDAGLQLWARPRARPLWPLVYRPYRGLLPFEPEHRRFFFGRDAERTEIIGDLMALRVAGRPRFLVVAGASGTGKSSVVRAGALPALLDDRGVARDDAPVREALAALARAADRSDGIQRSIELLRAELQRHQGEHWRAAIMRPGQHPDDALDAALNTPGDGPLLVLVDQFEELFTLTDEPRARLRFARRLWDLARAGDGSTHVVITIRVDFLGQCGDLVLDETGVRLDRVAYDEAHRVFVAQMTPEQLRTVIEQPAYRVGLRFEAGLVDRILADLAHQPGALPLLSYALDQLWAARVDDTLTQAAYAAMGGVAGALHGKADALFAGFSEAQRTAARALLVRLVAVGVGAREDSRRQETIAALRPGDGAVFDGVLAALVDARLLVRGEVDGEATVEVAHEALIRQWPTLQAWIEADREKLAAVAEVDGWIPAWKQYGTLLDGNALGYAASVRAKYPRALSADASGLIEASEAAQAARVARGRRRMRWAVAAALVMGALALLSFVSWRQSNHERDNAEAARKHQAVAAQEARQQRDRARIASIIAGARTLKTRDSITAGLLLAELPTERPDVLPPNTGLLVREVARANAPKRLLSTPGSLQPPRWTRDGRLLIVGRHGLSLVDKRGVVLRRDYVCDGSPATRVLNHPDHDWLVTVHANGAACRWPRADASPIRLLSGVPEPYVSARLTPDRLHVLLIQTSTNGGARKGVITALDPRTGRTSLAPRAFDTRRRALWLGPHRVLAVGDGVATVHTPDGQHEVDLRSCGEVRRGTDAGLLIGETETETVVCRLDGGNAERIWADPEVKQLHVLPDGDAVLLAPPPAGMDQPRSRGAPRSGRSLDEPARLVVWRCSHVPTDGFHVSAQRGDCRPTSLFATIEPDRRPSGLYPYKGTRFAAIFGGETNPRTAALVEFGPWRPEGGLNIKQWRFEDHAIQVDTHPNVLLTRDVAQGRDGGWLEIGDGMTPAASPDGVWVAASVRRKGAHYVGLWKLEDSEPRWVRHDGAGSAHFVGDGRHLLVHGPDDASIVNWHGKHLQSWSSVAAVDHDAEVVALRDGNRLSIQRLNGERLRPDTTFESTPERVTLGQTHAIAHFADDRLRVLDYGPYAGRGALLTVGPDSLVHSRGRWIVTESIEDGVLALRDAETLTLRHELDAQAFSRTCAVGLTTFACDDDTTVTVRSLETGEPILTAPIHEVGSFRYAAKGRLFLANSGDALRVWSTDDWTSFEIRPTALKRPIANFGASADGRLLIIEADLCLVYALPEHTQPQGSVACHVERVRGLLDRRTEDDPHTRAQRFVAMAEAAYDVHAETFNFDTGVRASPDGRHILVGAHPHLKASARRRPRGFADYVAIHRVDWSDLITYLRTRTEICLTVNQRMIWLAEGRVEAEAAVAACEAKSQQR